MSLQEFDFETDRRNYIPSRNSKPQQLHPLVWWSCVVFLVLAGLHIAGLILSAVQMHNTIGGL